MRIRLLIFLFGLAISVVSCSHDEDTEVHYGVVAVPAKNLIADMDSGSGVQQKDANYVDDEVNLVDGSWVLIFKNSDGEVVLTETIVPDNFNESEQSYIVDDVPFGFYDLVFTNYAYGGDTIGELLPAKITEDVAGQVDMQYAGAAYAEVTSSDMLNTIEEDAIVAKPQLAQVEVTYEGFTNTTVNLYGEAAVNLEQGKFYYIVPGESVSVFFKGTKGGQLYAMLVPLDVEKQKKYTLNFVVTGGVGDGLVIDMSVSEEMAEGWGGPLEVPPSEIYGR